MRRYEMIRMTQVRQKHVIFVGTSMSVRETLEEIATQRGVVIHALGSMQDRHGRLVHEKGTLLVMELDGDGAAALHSMAEVKQRHPQVPVLAIVDRGDIPATSPRRCTVHREPSKCIAATSCASWVHPPSSTWSRPPP